MIGTIAAVGDNVRGWQLGDRAGVGWFGGSCGYCARCRRGIAFACENIQAVTGVTCDGGYATHLVADVSAVAHVPADLDEVESAPLLCAGVTTFNALRKCGASPGDLVVVTWLLRDANARVLSRGLVECGENRRDFSLVTTR